MNRSVRDWLPAGTLAGGRISATIVDVVEQWSRKWIATGRITTTDPRTQAGAILRLSGWQVPGTAFATAGSASEHMRLAGMAMDVESERLVLSEADRHTISRFAAAIAADLALALDSAFGLPPTEREKAGPAEVPFANSDGLSFSLIGTKELPVLHCAVPLAALVPFRKASIRQSPDARIPLCRLGRAFDATGVRVEARLGEARLRLGELNTLAPGDVLILGRSIDDGAEVVLAPQGRPFARGAIDQGTKSFSLLLSQQDRDS